MRILSANILINTVFITWTGSLALSGASSNENSPLKNNLKVSERSSKFLKPFLRGEDQLSSGETSAPVIPEILNGRKKFQFFLKTSTGGLKKTWLSLQTIQEMLLTQCNIELPAPQSIKANRTPNKSSFFRPLWHTTREKRPENSVENILANIHKVMKSQIKSTDYKKNKISKEKSVVTPNVIATETYTPPMSEEEYYAKTTLIMPDDVTSTSSLEETTTLSEFANFLRFDGDVLDSIMENLEGLYANMSDQTTTRPPDLKLLYQPSSWTENLNVDDFENMVQTWDTTTTDNSDITSNVLSEDSDVRSTIRYNFDAVTEYPSMDLIEEEDISLQADSDTFFSDSPSLAMEKLENFELSISPSGFVPSNPTDTEGTFGEYLRTTTGSYLDETQRYQEVGVDKDGYQTMSPVSFDTYTIVDKIGETPILSMNVYETIDSNTHVENTEDTHKIIAGIIQNGEDLDKNYVYEAGIKEQTLDEENTKLSVSEHASYDTESAGNLHDEDYTLYTYPELDVHPENELSHLNFDTYGDYSYDSQPPIESILNLDDTYVIDQALHADKSDSTRNEEYFDQSTDTKNTEQHTNKMQEVDENSLLKVDNNQRPAPQNDQSILQTIKNILLQQRPTERREEIVITQDEQLLSDQDFVSKDADPATQGFEVGQQSKEASSQVLPSNQIANGPGIGLPHVEYDHGVYEEYDFDDPPIYLEDIEENVYPDKDNNINVAPPQSSLNDTTYDFPSPNTTTSYNKPTHVLQQLHGSQSSSEAGSGSEGQPLFVDPTQFLPAFNPQIAIQKGNPLRDTPEGNLGLLDSTKDQDPKITDFVNTMNDISFQVYKMVSKVYRRQNMVMSPLNLISMLNMLRFGTRSTSTDRLSGLLRAEKFYSINTHLLLKNITREVLALNGDQEVAFYNGILIEKPLKKAHNMDFFSQTIEFFYGAGIEQVPQAQLGVMVRDKTNEHVRKQTLGSVHNFLKPNASLTVFGPISLASSAYFQLNWRNDVVETDLVDMSFIRFPSAERRLIRTVGISKTMDVKAGYSRQMDATVTEIPLKTPTGLDELSLILVMPGQQTNFVANGLSQLEQSLSMEKWNTLLKSVTPHTLRFKMPIFSHRNYLNLSDALFNVGLRELFSPSADFSGMNGAKNLHLGDVFQLTEFHSCKLNLKEAKLRRIEEYLKIEEEKKRMKRSIKKNLTKKEQENLHLGKEAVGEKDNLKEKLIGKFVKKADVFDFDKEEEEESKVEITGNRAISPFKRNLFNDRPSMSNLKTLSVGKNSFTSPSSQSKWKLSENNRAAKNLASNTQEQLSRSANAKNLVSNIQEQLSSSEDSRAEKSTYGGFYRSEKTLAYDRAFFYVVRHNPTGMVLFIGRYLDPETY